MTNAMNNLKLGLTNFMEFRLPGALLLRIEVSNTSCPSIQQKGTSQVTIIHAEGKQGSCAALLSSDLVSPLNSKHTHLSFKSHSTSFETDSSVPLFIECIWSNLCREGVLFPNASQARIYCFCLLITYLLTLSYNEWPAPTSTPGPCTRNRTSIHTLAGANHVA